MSRSDFNEPWPFDEPPPSGVTDEGLDELRRYHAYLTWCEETGERPGYYNWRAKQRDGED